MPDPDLEIRGGGVIQTLRQGGGGLPKKLFWPSFGPHFGLRIRGGGAPPVPPMEPPLYHDIRFTVVSIDRGLVVHGVGQVSMQTRGTSKARKA